MMPTIAAFSFGELILPWLLFNDYHHAGQYEVSFGDHHPQLPFVSSLIATNNAKSDVIAPSPEPIDGAKTYDEWNIPNGNVKFARPFSFRGIEVLPDGKLKSSVDSKSSSAISLWNPQFLGRCVE